MPDRPLNYRSIIVKPAHDFSFGETDNAIKVLLERRAEIARKIGIPVLPFISRVDVSGSKFIYSLIPQTKKDRDNDRKSEIEKIDVKIVELKQRAGQRNEHLSADTIDNLAQQGFVWDVFALPRADDTVYQTGANRGNGYFVQVEPSIIPEPAQSRRDLNFITAPSVAPNPNISLNFTTANGYVDFSGIDYAETQTLTTAVASTEDYVDYYTDELPPPPPLVPEMYPQHHDEHDGFVQRDNAGNIQEAQTYMSAALTSSEVTTASTDAMSRHSHEPMLMNSAVKEPVVLKWASVLQSSQVDQNRPDPVESSLPLPPPTRLRGQ